MLGNPISFSGSNAMAARNVRVFGLAIQLLLLTVSLAVNPAFADADEFRVQFCWAFGKFDNTIYLAEAEAREDRQANFETLIAISGIDHHPVECRTSDLKLHRLVRAELTKEWLESGSEIVNTTFLSDLDY
jgi:hypothetical protein